MHEETNELINEYNHLKERLYQLEKVKAEREVVVRQLQQVADIKQHLPEASLEGTSHHPTNTEAKTQDLKKTSQQMRCLIDDLTAKLEIVSSQSLHQGEKIQSLQQELLM